MGKRSGARCKAAKSASSPRAFVAGILIGLSIVTPALAASAEGFEDWHLLLLIGSAVLLVAGIILKARASRAARSRLGEAAPDMRHSRVVDTSVDHPLSFDVAPRRQFH
jgi:hypothetical protein